MSIGYAIIIREDYKNGKQGSMSPLAIFLRDELERRGWTARKLETLSGVPDSTISRILNNEPHEVKATVIARLARALGITFWRLMQIAGYTTETPEDPSDDEETARIAVLLAVDPNLTPLFDRISQLSKANRNAVLTYAELLIAQQGDPPVPPESQ